MTHIKKEGVKVVQDSEDGEEDEDSEDEAMGQDQEELRSFEGNREDCKLVLVVRTDLGMTKGKTTLSYPQSSENSNKSFRQNSSSMLSRDLSMLQALPFSRARLSTTEALGVSRSSEDCITDHIRGTDGRITSQGYEHGPLCTGDP